MMNSLKLFFYQSVFLVTLYRGCFCTGEYISMAMSEVKILDNLKNTSTTHKHQLLMNSVENKDEYFFMHEGLQEKCGQKFKSGNIEIRYAFGRTLEFSLTPTGKNLTITCQFVSNGDLQLFFSQQREAFILQRSSCVSIRKSFLFSATKGKGRVPVANDNVFYRVRAYSGANVFTTMSFNLVRLYSKRNAVTGSATQTQEADLVFSPRTFNITAMIGNDKFGLCLQRIPNVIFIFRFVDSIQAMHFFTTVGPEINTQIICSFEDDWLAQRIEYIDAPQPFKIRQHPFLEGNSPWKF